MEALFAGEPLQASQCYRLLDWLDKVRVGVWLAYSTLHKEFFRPKFRIDQRPAAANDDRPATWPIIVSCFRSSAVIVVLPAQIDHQGDRHDNGADAGLSTS